MGSRRNTELGLLFLAALPVALIFALVGTQASRAFSWTYLGVPLCLFALFAAAHVALRFLAPNADSVLLPIAFLLCGIGIAFITRLAPVKAFMQILWLFVGVVALIGVLYFVPALERLGNYKYILMVIGIVLLLAPALVGKTINGSKLWIVIGSFSIQPGEIARILIIVFLASYLAENREMLSISTYKLFRVIPMPAPRTLGPLLLMWTLSFLVMIAEKDLGSSLLFFGIFLIMVYAATGKLSYVFLGLILFAIGAVAAYFMFDHVQTRVAIWLHPFEDPAGKSYQLVQSLFAFADGGLFGRGIGAGMPTRIPFVDTDFIFAAIGEEMGLLGAGAILIAFLIFIFRGFGIAARAKTDMASFTAVGLTSSIGLQLFVIVGGVTGLIPLTGITVPFMSRGGSSMLSTFLLLGLLLRAGDAETGLASQMTSAGKGVAALGRLALSNRLRGLTVLFSLLIIALITQLTSLQVVQAKNLQSKASNTRSLARDRYNERGDIVTSDGVTLAESVKRADGTYKRVYPHGNLAAHTVGYYSEKYGRSGVERAADQELTGRRDYQTFKDVIDAATDQPIQGNTVRLTINSKVQSAAQKALQQGTGKGAMVVLDPRNGAVLAAASNPSFNPNKVTQQWQSLNTDENAPLLDRSRQTRLAPGSTFKVVTLTGAYANDIAKPETRFKAPAKIEIGGGKITNFEQSSYPMVTLKQATAKSINTVFAQLGVELGADKLVAQSEKFGFNKEIPYDLYIQKSLMPDPDEMTEWETAWAADGQPVGQHASPAGPQATVFQMALVAAGIANDGKIMKPYVIEDVTDQNEATQQDASSTEADNGITKLFAQKGTRWLTACDAATANEVTDAMIDVVRTGSGAGARISGTTVAGKTGTAEVGKTRTPNAWFIAFAPAENPTVAIAIMLENGGQGGRIAAPAAKNVIQTALEQQKESTK